MKITYLIRNRGIASRTPEGWKSAVISAQADGSYTEEDLREVADADFLVVGLEPVTEVLLDRARRLKLVQRLGVGYDNVDLDAAARIGVHVCNMPDFNAASVAEHTLMLILGLLRRVFESSLSMKAGRWPLHAIVANGVFELPGKTLGIIGLGAIGQEVARRAKTFEVEICYFDERRSQMAVEEALGASFVSLDNLLRRADIVTLHVPLTSGTFRMIGRTELGKMKRTAILINTARGAIVDEEALADALEQGVIAGAGLDVFAEEPLDPRHRLRRCPNVLLTPHVAGQSREAMERMVEVMLENIQRVARGEEPRHQVNPR
ncbi:MAG: 2-hydroxyacid dehydrogenase [Candidatus Methylomirabilis sp.]